MERKFSKSRFDTLPLPFWSIILKVSKKLKSGLMAKSYLAISIFFSDFMICKKNFDSSYKSIFVFFLEFIGENYNYRNI